MKILRLSACLPLAALFGAFGCGTIPSGESPRGELSVDLGDGVTLELVLIRPGSFTMGSEIAADEKPVRRVTLSKPFYIGRFEVTQAQWEAVMGENPSRLKGARNPIDHVSWDDCQRFLAKLKEKVPGRAFSLPTEARWEYACRAGGATVYGFGDDEGAFGEHGWCAENAEKKAHPVGEKKPNAWGLYDMHGNVYEWCQDWYVAYPPGDATDPTGGATGTEHVLRGGSWSDGPKNCASAHRRKRP
ncbi:MAG: formylglycine-generating enzyme family protein, partial [Planctomycetota bacterium]